MPTYEYRCEKCRNRFERVQHVAEHVKAKARCPKCGSVNVERVFSTFFAKTGKKS
ncbi:MAG: FmdB family zinc ribbon protein [Chromatiales bacterium]